MKIVRLKNIFRKDSLEQTIQSKLEDHETSHGDDVWENIVAGLEKEADPVAPNKKRRVFSIILVAACMLVASGLGFLVGRHSGDSQTAELKISSASAEKQIRKSENVPAEISNAVTEEKVASIQNEKQASIRKKSTSVKSGKSSEKLFVSADPNEIQTQEISENITQTLSTEIKSDRISFQDELIIPRAAKLSLASMNYFPSATSGIAIADAVKIRKSPFAGRLSASYNAGMFNLAPVIEAKNTHADFDNFHFRKNITGYSRSTNHSIALEYDLTDKFSFTAGVGVNNVTEQLRYNIQTVYQDTVISVPTPVDPTSPYAQAPPTILTVTQKNSSYVGSGVNGFDVLEDLTNNIAPDPGPVNGPGPDPVPGTIINRRVEYETINRQNSYQWIEIPVSIIYRPYQGKIFSCFIETGASYSFCRKFNVVIPKIGENSTYEFQNKNDLSKHFVLQGKVGAEIKISRFAAIRIAPAFRRSAGSIYNYQDQIQYKTQGMGIVAGLNIRM